MSSRAERVSYSPEKLYSFYSSQILFSAKARYQLLAIYRCCHLTERRVMDLFSDKIYSSGNDALVQTVKMWDCQWLHSLISTSALALTPMMTRLFSQCRKCCLTPSRCLQNVSPSVQQSSFMFFISAPHDPLAERGNITECNIAR